MLERYTYLRSNWWFAVALLFACFLVPGRAGANDQEQHAAFERDREAILAMAGNYHVQFSFRETVAFVQGYTLKQPYEPDGYEIVRVIRDDEYVISLQHILVTKGIWEDHVPTKHWRQDWVYEPTQIVEYLGHNVWRTKNLDEAERRGKWGQFVYQVDDSPRYAAVAAWDHDRGVSEWTSPPTWRPLPRRDASKRDDYDVLMSVNRHALTPNGWVHEQDSSKVILRDTPQVLVHEFGVNTYTQSDNFNVQMADDYWSDTKDFWSEVRKEWSSIENQLGTFGIRTKDDAGKLYNQILELAKEAREGKLENAEAAQRAREIIRASTMRKTAEVNARLSRQAPISN
ncbi:hypothetical protein YTPLAS18_02900 [Nitrospira sp.]|nr:hypothetical protein YTPLAS18_02900 [Nitrospira sp.]